MRDIFDARGAHDGMPENLLYPFMTGGLLELAAPLTACVLLCNCVATCSTTNVYSFCSRAPVALEQGANGVLICDGVALEQGPNGMLVGGPGGAGGGGPGMGAGGGAGERAR
eukprot:scaffold205039_cov22-Tisochrysis_lutea.AAC.1